MTETGSLGRYVYGGCDRSWSRSGSDLNCRKVGEWYGRGLGAMRGAVQMTYTVEAGDSERLPSSSTARRDVRCCDQHIMFMLRLTFMLGGKNGKRVATPGLYREERLGWLGFGDLPWM